MLQAVLDDRVAVAAFLAPAEVMWADGLLTVRLPPDCGYHYESLLEPAVRDYVEATAHKFFAPLLAVQLVWAGAHPKPSLEEGARILAKAVEGRILGEGDDGSK